MVRIRSGATRAMTQGGTSSPTRTPEGDAADSAAVGDASTGSTCLFRSACSDGLLSKLRR